MLLTLVTVGLLAGGAVGWADLRPQGWKPSDEELREGRRRLQRVAREHGLEAWERAQTMQVVATDEWSQGSGWWPMPKQRFRADRILGTFTSRTTLLDGPATGQTWGLQAWRPYVIGAEGETTWPSQNRAISFYLPTLQYFDELPFRLLEAPLIASLPAATRRGKQYDRLLVTWGRFDPHARHDQYEVWIDPSSERIAMVTYTLRDSERFASLLLRPAYRKFAIGTMHYDDYRTIDGVLVPFRQSVVIGGADAVDRPHRDYLHQLRVQSVSFGAVAPAALQPAGPGPDDRQKPDDPYRSIER